MPRPLHRERQAAEHRVQVAERLRLDRPDGEVAEQRVVGGGHRAAAGHVVHLRRVPDVVTGRRPAGRRAGRADRHLAGRRLDRGALGERGHPAPQIEPLGPAQRVRTPPGSEPRRVARHRRGAPDGHRGGRQPGPPVPPAPGAILAQAADQQHDREHEQHRQALAAHVDGAPGQQARQKRDRPRDPPGIGTVPQYEQHGHHDQEGEQGLGHHHVLVFDHEPVEQHGQRAGRSSRGAVAIISAVAPVQGYQVSAMYTAAGLRPVALGPVRERPARRWSFGHHEARPWRTA